jgi:hypothetical protein
MSKNQIAKLVGALIIGLAFANLIPLKAFSAPAPLVAVDTQQ